MKKLREFTNVINYQLVLSTQDFRVLSQALKNRYLKANFHQ